MVECEILYKDSDNIIRVKNLRNESTGALITGATVTAQILDATDTPVTGVPDPITFTETAGKTGWYEGIVPDSASVTLGQLVKIKVVADAGVNLKRTWLFEDVKVDQ